MKAAGILGILAAFCGSYANAATVPPAGWDTVYDFAVQDVCVDHEDKIIPDATPLDDASKCSKHRNMKPGELPPYHKNDWPTAAQAETRPNGNQSNDTFPILTKGYGVAVVQLRSFLDPAGKPLPYQPRRGGGGVYLFSDTTMASGVTEDPNGLQFFYGPNCSASDPLRRIFDAWVVVDKSYEPERPGHMVARLTRFPERCARLTYAYTSWLTRPVTFRVRSNGAETKRSLQTLISDHFGGESLERASNMERFYFTRELGLVRWERWQNFDRQKREQDQQRASDLQAAGQCDSVEAPPAAPGHWVMVRCRQYTNLIKSADPSADIAQSWLAKLRSSPDSQGYFRE